MMSPSVGIPLVVVLLALAFSTLLSPLIPPLAMMLLAGADVPIAAGAMMISILKMTIALLTVGLVMQRLLPGVARRLANVLPCLAMFAICTIIGVTIALPHEQLLDIDIAIFAACVCHNAAGYVLGYWGGRLSGLNEIDARTCALEIGIQYGGMATGLAFNVLHSSTAALGAADFGPWSAITSSAPASWWRRQASPPATATPSS